jgi:hypothetical protein
MRVGQQNCADVHIHASHLAHDLYGALGMPLAAALVGQIVAVNARTATLANRYEVSREL